MIKFSLSNKTIKFSDKTLYRIKAEISFGKIQEGDLGGFIEKENNLTQEGNAWVSGNAKVFGSAEVSGNAEVSNFKLINIIPNFARLSPGYGCPFSGNSPC